MRPKCIIILISSVLLAGKENRAYVSEGQAAPSTRPTSSAGGKWANNYVPYDGFPQGSKEVIFICAMLLQWRYDYIGIEMDDFRSVNSFSNYRFI